MKRRRKNKRAYYGTFVGNMKRKFLRRIGYYRYPDAVKSLLMGMGMGIIWMLGLCYNGMMFRL